MTFRRIAGCPQQLSGPGPTPVLAGGEGEEVPAEEERRQASGPPPLNPPSAPAATCLPAAGPGPRGAPRWIIYQAASCFLQPGAAARGVGAREGGREGGRRGRPPPPRLRPQRPRLPPALPTRRRGAYGRPCLFGPARSRLPSAPRPPPRRAGPGGPHPAAPPPAPRGSWARWGPQGAWRRATPHPPRGRDQWRPGRGVGAGGRHPAGACTRPRIPGLACGRPPGGAAHGGGRKPGGARPRRSRSRPSQRPRPPPLPPRCHWPGGRAASPLAQPAARQHTSRALLARPRAGHAGKRSPRARGTCRPDYGSQEPAGQSPPQNKKK